MKKLILVVFAIGALLSSCSDTGKKVETKDAEEVSISKNESTAVYNKINTGSHVAWRASHLGGVGPRFGKINLKSAELLVNDGQLTNAVVEMDMTTFTVENFEDEGSKAKLTGHLQGDDFFMISTYPTSKFELTNITKSEGDYNVLATGNLSILDVTKSITFKANVSISDNKISVKSEDFSVDRTDWGLTYNTEGTAGVPTDYLIANNIGFAIDVSLTK
ncbi:MAG: YceI family protein [Bacteroidetes bacterium]|nr:YceI family protein [Bacteroidota bacterium]